MALHAILIRYPLLIKHLAYLMRGMTVYTDWYPVGFGLPQFAPYNLGMHFLDLTVTLLAGIGHIISVN
jgi:hypothetical protein